MCQDKALSCQMECWKLSIFSLFLSEDVPKEFLPDFSGFEALQRVGSGGLWSHFKSTNRWLSSKKWQALGPFDSFKVWLGEILGFKSGLQKNHMFKASLTPASSSKHPFFTDSSFVFVNHSPKLSFYLEMNFISLDFPQYITYYFCCNYHHYSHSCSIYILISSEQFPNFTWIPNLILRIGSLMGQDKLREGIWPKVTREPGGQTGTWTGLSPV